MKTTNKFLALAIGAVAMTFASCSSDDEVSNVPSQKEIETNIIGKWKTTFVDGQDVLTNERMVANYFADKSSFFSASRSFGSMGYVWADKTDATYNVIGDILQETIPDYGIVQYSTINSINDKYLTYTLDKIVMPNGTESKKHIETRFERVNIDYSKDIIGMWEGVEMTGYETYGNAEARIEYKADGTYTYYKKVDDEWQPLADVIDEWNVDGDWLATRWQNKGSDVMNYEWWDIDYIKDGMMKWSALREKEDGTRFTTTFTWKKMERPTDQEIKKNIVGKWKATTLDGKPMVTEERDIITFNADGTETYTASRLDVELDDFVWSNKSSYKYSISNGILTETSADGRIRFDGDVLLADGDVLVIDYTGTWKDDKKSDAPNTRVVFKKVAADYTNDVIGLWECDDYNDVINGTNARIRIELNADGTYKYYEYADGTWKRTNDTSNDYIVDGDWITVRYSTDNMESFTIEAWDIDEVKNDTMKWSALYKKEDGKIVTTNIEWKKVK